MINIAVCDDNIQFANLLVQHLERLCIYKLPPRVECKVLPAFSLANQVIEYLNNDTIDILFLDIDMKETNGFELAKMLCDTYPDTIIIFVSAYEEFVYSSFEYCPFRFLRKSHLTREIDDTFEKVIERCVINNETLEFNTVDGAITLRVKEIMYFEGQKNYFYIYTQHGKIYKCRGTMESVEKACSQYDFFRIHSAYVVNHNHIESVNSAGFVVMKNGKCLSVSKRRMSAFKGSYMSFVRRRISK